MGWVGLFGGGGAGHRVGHGVDGCVVVGWVVLLCGPHDTSLSWGASDAPMLFFDNLVTKFDQIIKK